MLATDSATRKFADSLDGSLISPTDSAYDEARRGYNGMIDRRPAIICRCASTDDVARAIDFSRSHDLQPVVRGGGHSIAGSSSCDGGLIIDLSGMQRIWVEPASRTVRAEGGTLWSQFDKETQRFGLATTGGTISTTGIGGLTLGGGFGWLMRHYGLTCDNLISADVILADGRRLTASASEHPDLYWALRGGGANFGVVTSFEYRLHAVNMVLGGLVIHPVNHARDVLRFYREFADAAPDELTLYAACLTTPDGPVVAMAACYSGDTQEGERVLARMRAFGKPVADTIGLVSYADTQQTLMDAAYPSGVLNYWKTGFLGGLDDGFIERLVDAFAVVPSAMTAVAIEQLGGAVGRVPMDSTAFAHRTAAYNLLITSLWRNPAESEQNIAWTRDLFKAMQPYAHGMYQNYLSGDEVDSEVDSTYGSNIQRLAQVKRTYDPDNFFPRA